jgi:hypothetical protein
MGRPQSGASHAKKRRRASKRKRGLRLTRKKYATRGSCHATRNALIANGLSTALGSEGHSQNGAWRATPYTQKSRKSLPQEKSRTATYVNNADRTFAQAESTSRIAHRIAFILRKENE